MTDSPAQHMQCMEVWGGSQLTSNGVELGGLDVWVYSKPFGEAQPGGDVYYVSSCASGRISRLLLADVSGHGQSVASTAADLRTLMRRFVNRLDQKEVVRLLNEQFTALSRHGSFATPAIRAPFFFARPKAAGLFSVMATTTRRRRPSAIFRSACIVNLLGDVPGEKLIPSLLQEISERFPQNLAADDVTLLVVRANGRSLHFSFREKLEAFGRS